MKNIAFILLSLAIASCNEEKSSNSESKVEQEYENGVVYNALFKNIILGDFNGDGKEDELTESLFSAINNKSIDALPNLVYDSLVEYVVDLDPVLKLKSKNEDIPELLITENTSFGLIWIKNEGDLNNDGTDEISIVIDWADWSAINRCIVYSLRKNIWVELAKFEVREWQIYDNPDFSGFISKNKKGIYEVSTFDSGMNEVLKPLNEVLVTSPTHHALNDYI